MPLGRWTFVSFLAVNLMARQPFVPDSGACTVFHVCIESCFKSSVSNIQRLIYSCCQFLAQKSTFPSGRTYTGQTSGAVESKCTPELRGTPIQSLGLRGSQDLPDIFQGKHMQVLRARAHANLHLSISPRRPLPEQNDSPLPALYVHTLDRYNSHTPQTTLC